MMGLEAPWVRYAPGDMGGAWQGLPGGLLVWWKAREGYGRCEDKSERTTAFVAHDTPRSSQVDSSQPELSMPVRLKLIRNVR